VQAGKWHQQSLPACCLALELDDGLLCVLSDSAAPQTFSFHHSFAALFASLVVPRKIDLFYLVPLDGGWFCFASLVEVDMTYTHTHIEYRIRISFYILLACLLAG